MANATQIQQAMNNLDKAPAALKPHPGQKPNWNRQQVTMKPVQRTMLEGALAQAVEQAGCRCEAIKENKSKGTKVVLRVVVETSPQRRT